MRRRKNGVAKINLRATAESINGFFQEEAWTYEDIILEGECYFGTGGFPQIKMTYRGITMRDAPRSINFTRSLIPPALIAATVAFVKNLLKKYRLKIYNAYTENNHLYIHAKPYGAKNPHAGQLVKARRGIPKIAAVSNDDSDVFDDA